MAKMITHVTCKKCGEKVTIIGRAMHDIMVHGELKESANDWFK